MLLLTCIIYFVRLSVINTIGMPFYWVIYIRKVTRCLSVSMFVTKDLANRYDSPSFHQSFLIGHKKVFQYLLLVAGSIRFILISLLNYSYLEAHFLNNQLLSFKYYPQWKTNISISYFYKSVLSLRHTVIFYTARWLIQ